MAVRISRSLKQLRLKANAALSCTFLNVSRKLLNSGFAAYSTQVFSAHVDPRAELTNLPATAPFRSTCFEVAHWMNS